MHTLLSMETTTVDGAPMTDRPEKNGHGGYTGPSAGRLQEEVDVSATVQIEIDDLSRLRKIIDRMEIDLKRAKVPGTVIKGKLNGYYELVARSKEVALLSDDFPRRAN